MTITLLDSTDKLYGYIADVGKSGVKILPLDINKSESGFVAEPEGIRFALLAVKSLGEGAIDRIVSERKSGGAFRSLQDFCTRVSGRDIHLRTVEALIKSGAFDGFGYTRREHLNACEDIMKSVTRSDGSVIEGQLDLFGMGAALPMEKKIERCGEFDEQQLLEFEHEALAQQDDGHQGRHQHAGKQQARRRGQTVYVETCPQYLLLDDSVYYNPDYSQAARYVCAPPIRSKENQEALWRGLRRGEIQTVSTDHCSFTLEQKDMGREDFTKIPGGLPGVETRGEVVYTIAASEKKLSLAGVCRALSENPAKLYGLFPRKGVIAAGSDADIVVYDPGASHVLRGAELLSKAGYTPFEGFRTNGGIAKVYLRGSLQVDGGKVIGGKMGEYLKRGKCAL